MARPAASSRSTRDDPLPHHVRPRRKPHRAGRGLFEGARHVARHRLGRSGLHRPARARSRRSRAVDGRAEAAGRPAWRWKASPTASPRRWRRNTRRRWKSPSAMPSKAQSYDLGHGDVVIAAITSCTNTSNPSVLIGAGLLARNANRRGLKQKPWVKTSLAPGSQVVAEYLDKSGLQKELDQIGFNLVGFGCTTCIGNSGPLPAPISKTINDKGLIAAAVLSGNRNFEGRVSPDVQANYLASPPLVVAYALAGTVTKDLTTEPLGDDRDGNPVFLKDIWPDSRGDRRVHHQERHARTVRAQICRRLQGRRKLAAASRRRKARPMPGTTIRPMCRTRPISSACAASPATSATSRAPACSACSATRSPPTTSRRPARSRRPRRPANT